uniref:RING finger and CHY zinc finger domain-containing protein 1 n=1 Tax=Dromaius novaehollandiae TaxID=8790 RepID=A0A8C4J015_DRONO
GGRGERRPCPGAGRGAALRGHGGGRRGGLRALPPWLPAPGTVLWEAVRLPAVPRRRRGPPTGPLPRGRGAVCPLPPPAEGAAELRELPQPLRGVLLRHLPPVRPRQETVPLRRVRHLQCIENVSRQDCPICLEDIHTSRVGAHVLPCGHLLHRTCYEDMLKEGYRCPLCMHSALDMTRYWRQLDDEVAQTPMPTEYQNMMVEILCNDCSARSTVQFHLLGMKCTNCESYNTAQDGKCRLTLE